MTLPEAIIQRFTSLFRGLERGHGTYRISQSPTPAGKKVKGKAATVSTPVTPDLWRLHLEGKTGLGIVPIMDDGKVNWGCIDVDIYNLDLEALSKRIHGTPLVLTRTKSGGAHIWLFSPGCSAEVMQRKLREVAAALGFGGCEIFPKQTELIKSRGDIGGWVNLPYFDYTKTTRYCIRDTVGLADLEDFLDYAKTKTLAESDVEALEVVKTKGKQDDGPLPDGPPCLQHLIRLGFPEGSRNNALYNIGVYLKKRSPDTMEKALEEMNRVYMTPPLQSREVQAVAKSLQRKDYQYKCKDIPICNHCDKSLCRTREYGVGSGDDDMIYPDLDSLVKIDTAPPSYFVNVDGVRMGPLETDELQIQQKFQRRCIEAINKVVPILKPRKYHKKLQDLMDDLQLVEAPPDSSPRGQLVGHLQDFITGRRQTDLKDEIYIGKCWADPETDLVWFRMRDFIEYLEQVRFKEFKSHQVTAILRDHNAKHKAFNLKKRCVQVWGMKIDEDRQEKVEPNSGKNGSMPF